MQVIPSKIKKILVLRNDRFGEFLLNIPAFVALRKNFPQAHLALVVASYLQGLAHCIEGIDEVMTWENRKHKVSEILSLASLLRKKSFDLSIVFNPSKEFNIICFLAGIPMRLGYNHKWPFLLTHRVMDKKYLAQKHEIGYNLDLLRAIGVETNEISFPLRIDDSWVDKLLNDYDLKNSDFVVLHPWTSDPVKQWPQENFIKLSLRLARELNKKVVIIGAKEALAGGAQCYNNLDTGIINLAGKTTLRELAALLKKSKLLISGDSGPVHLACAVNRPVLAIFRNDIQGKTAQRWGPAQKDSLVIEKASLSDITVEEVFSRLRRYFTG